MFKKIAIVSVALMFLSPKLRAQGGCVNSPENPTALLVVVGAGAAFAARVRRR